MTVNIFKLWDYIKKHWFQIGLLFLIIIAAMKRDFRFSFQLGGTAATNKKGETEIQRAMNTSQGTELAIVKEFFGDDKTKNESLIPEKTKINYLKRFAKVAVVEQKKFGIPASVTLAIALIQSKAGTNDRSQRSNNHFDLIATPDWKSVTEEYGNLRFRKYETAWLSFRDHSYYITSGQFTPLSKLNSNDYKVWLRSLHNLKYADNSESFVNDVQETIEKYKLFRLDKR